MEGKNFYNFIIFLKREKQVKMQLKIVYWRLDTGMLF